MSRHEFRFEPELMMGFQAMLMQVLSLSPDQINALDPGQRQSIVQLVRFLPVRCRYTLADDPQRLQFLGTA